MRYANKSILSASDAASANSPAIDTNQIIAMSLQAVWSDADLVGTVKLQGSNDVCPASHGPNTFVPTNWTDLPGVSAITIAGGAAGSGMIVVPQMCSRWVRAVVTADTPGTGTIALNMFSLSL